MSKFVSPQMFFTKVISSAIGPYCTATLTKTFTHTICHTSGIIAIPNGKNELVSDKIDAQADLCLDYLTKLMIEVGGSLENIAKVTIFLNDMNDFAVVNEIYKKYFTTHFPARACVQVARLPKDAKIEIEAIAYLPVEDKINF